MKKHKFLACLLAGAMVLSMAACGDPASVSSASTSDPVAEVTQAPKPETPAYVYDDTASITFADGKFAFLGSDATYNPAAKESTFELVTRNGRNAVKVTNSGKIYVALQLEALLGDKLADVKSVEFGVETETGSSFVATSGTIAAYLGEDNAQEKTDWSIYLEKKNPKTVSANFKGNAVAGNYVVFVLDVNSGSSYDAANPTTLYMYTISFKDANGNVLPVDTAAEYVAPSNDGPDRSNLISCSSYTDLGFAKAAGAWAQDGIEITEDVLAQLVPGTLLEIEYSSEDGDIWVVMPWAAAGWSRCAQSDAYINDSKTTAQVTYEQIAAVCGDDTSTWGLCIQCEGSSAWEVYSVKIGTVGAAKEFVKTADFEGFAKAAGAWAQDGLEMPQAVIDALVPGSVVRAQYTSEDGALWIVMPDADAGWSRCAQGTADCDGLYCYVTYEQIAEVCGEDKSTWGARMQFEGSSAWEVYAVEVGKMEDAAEKEFVKAVEFEGFAKAAGAWAQDGLEMPQAVIDALVPGSVVEIQYTSEDGDLWIVMPDADAGWSRCAQGSSVHDGSKCYITYEQIAAVCGEDKSTWGARMQCEGSSAWEVYAVAIGTMQEKGNKAFKKAVEFEGFAKAAGAWAQDGLEMPQAVIDALVPGSVVEIQYTSEDGDLWIVMPDAAAGWSRCAQGSSVHDGSKCYVTYEQIAAVCGEDKSTWGARMQCEGSSAWEVYAVSIGTMEDVPEGFALHGLKEIEGFAKAAGAWAQDGVELSEDMLAKLVPGSVVKISYTSEDGNLWLVMPWATAGWMRVGQAGTDDPAICDGSTCYVTYEQIEALCGEDKSTWGAMMQCEGSSAWEVYSVSIGQR